jgi:protein tyrosine/serine phosphatase
MGATMTELADTDLPHPRQHRLDRWRRPLATRWDRLRAWTNMIFVDHGFFRLVYLNLHRISGRAWRSAQPLPYQIKWLARRGVRSVVSLRGGQSFGSLPLEIEACREAGVSFETFVMRSRAIPTPEEIRDMKALFDRLEYPVLFHCKSGADRAGMMAALYLVLHEGRPVAEARRQLHLRFGHMRHGKTGVLGAFFDAYERDQPDGAMPLIEWAATRYDPKTVTEGFQPLGIGLFVTERLLRRE